MPTRDDDLPAVGLDMGTFAVKGVLIDRDTVRQVTVPTAGRPVQSARRCLEQLLGADPAGRVRLGLTGANAHLLAQEVGVRPLLEIEALAAGLAFAGIRADAVLSLGHENMYYLEVDGQGRPVFFNRNGQCAAGSGSFWYQQATRMGYDDRGLATLALEADSPVPISGRCAIFAKSDMTHAINEGATTAGVAAGLARTLADMVVHGVAQGRVCGRERVLVVGGVAANPAVVRYLRECCGDGRLTVPEAHEYLAALGAAARGRPVDLAKLDLASLLARRYVPSQPLPRLNPATVRYLPVPPPPAELDVSLVYLGVDCGSVSTKCVLLDRRGGIIGGVYLPTAGRPALQVLELIRRVRAEYGELLRNSRIIACTTGSGRFLSRKTLGAEYAVDEITCQAEGVKYLCGGDDDLAVIEIGGEDAKFLQLRKGILYDYRMNPVCAAGTGTFLENLAGLLGVDIATDFSRLAFEAEYALDLGDTCTLLSQSALAAAASQGLPLPSQLASLAYSAARNYLRKTAENRPMEGRVIFTGATAYNHALASAFATELGREVTVPPRPELSGALGAALVARRFHEAGRPGDGSFGGLELLHDFRRSRRRCRSRCEHGHRCTLDVISFPDGSTVLYGDRCGRHSGLEAGRAARHADLPDAAAPRNALLDRVVGEGAGPAVGIPRGGLYFDLYPFWAAFFRELGARVVVSGPASERTLREGKRRLGVELCYPLEMLVGQYQELLEQGVDFLFVPEVIDLEPLPWARAWPRAFTCPLLQTLRGTVTSALRPSPERVLYAPLTYRRGRRVLARQLEPAARRLLGTGYHPRRLERAVAAACREQERFERAMEREGRRMVEELPRLVGPDRIAAVFLGRPYTVYDAEASKRSLEHARHSGIVAVPQEYLLAYARGWYEGRIPSGRFGSRAEFRRAFAAFAERADHIYPAQAQRILSAAFLARYLNARGELPTLHLVLQDPFKCGPNAMLRHYLDMVTEGLRLTMDEHTAPAGMITRLEAFRNTCQSRPGYVPPALLSARTASVQELDLPLLVPEPSPHARVFVSLFRRYGVEAHLLPRSPDPDLALARRHVNGDECLPFIQNLQDFLEYLERDGREKVAFFQGTAWGPCRYGLYAPTQALVLARAGRGERLVCSVGLADAVRRFGLSFAVGIFDGLVAMDVLTALLLATRPYERQTGAAQAVFDAFAAELTSLLESFAPPTPVWLAGRHLEPLEDLLRRAAAAFAAVPRSPEVRPRIVVAGEFYVRLDDRCNQQVIRRVEEAGGEVSLSPACELFQYSAYINHWEARVDWRLGREIGRLVRQLGFGVLTRLAHREEARLARAGGIVPEPQPAQLQQAASPYVSEHYGGEPPMTIGRAVALARSGLADGVIFVAPFNCMPGAVVEVQLNALRRDLGIPVAMLYYDGKASANRDEHLRSLVFQAAELRRGSAGS